MKLLVELKLWSAGYRGVHRRDVEALCPPDEPGKAGLMIKSLPPRGWVSTAFLASTT